MAADLAAPTEHADLVRRLRWALGLALLFIPVHLGMSFLLARAAGRPPPWPVAVIAAVGFVATGLLASSLRRGPGPGQMCLARWLQPCLAAVALLAAVFL
ncbi:MAG: hypothetical protein HY906_06345, partial [Deltaproteobacteria bacterium]|nr:hypothetical protein [Deltaproteobacteria bacterium]